MPKLPAPLPLEDKNTGSSTGPKRCCVIHCEEEGLYKAPKSRETPGNYYWFCLLHVREYNARWDFFSGMSEEQIISYHQGATHGFKPTWSKDTAGHFNREGEVRERLRTLFGESKKPKPEAAANLPKEISRALSVLELPYPTSKTAIKVSYKKLVKQYHPDLNRDDPKAEERFRDVHQSYKILIESPYFKF